MENLINRAMLQEELSKLHPENGMIKKSEVMQILEMQKLKTTEEKKREKRVEEYRKSQAEFFKKRNCKLKRYRNLGILFLITSVIFAVLAFVLKKPDVLEGAVVQFFAGCALIIFNTNMLG